MAKYDCIFHRPEVVTHYEWCRCVSDTALQTLIKQLYCYVGKESSRTSKIIEVGAGDGRFFIPFIDFIERISQKKVKMIGLDISAPMLHKLKKKIENKNFQQCEIELLKWDMQDPYPEYFINFNLVYSVASLHIPVRWKESLKNAVQCLSPKGRFLMIKEINQFMHQTEGFEGDSDLEKVDEILLLFMRKYHELRNYYGYPFIREGILYSDFSNPIAELKQLGFNLNYQFSDDGLKWQKPHRYNQMLEALAEGYITTWGSDLPTAIRKKISKHLAYWLKEKEIKIQQEFNIPSRFELFIFGLNNKL